MNIKLYRKELEKINSYKPGKPIEEVKRDLKLKQVYKLASNEIPFCPTYITKAIELELKNINRYPQADCYYLRDALAKKLRVAKEQIVFGNGSDELIVLTLKALTKESDEVIVSYPTFLIYEIQAKISNTKVVRVPSKDLRYDLDEIVRKITKKTKIIFIANPDNPTGTFLSKIEIENFLKKVPKSVLVYFDEAYFEFAPKDFPNTLQLLKKNKNIMLTRTFSKAYGLAGLRIGYGVVSKEIADILNKIREPFNINRFAQVAAIAALRNKKFLKEVLEFTKKEKLYFYKELEKERVKFTKSSTNFILINFGKDGSKFSNYLLKSGIIIRDLKSWGLNGFIRVTVGRSKENRKFINCLKRYLSKNLKRSH